MRFIVVWADGWHVAKIMNRTYHTYRSIAKCESESDAQYLRVRLDAYDKSQLERMGIEEKREEEAND